MAQIHNEIRKGTLSDAVKRALGVTRGEGGVERFGETLTPIIHPWGMPEWAYLRADRLCGVARDVAAGGAGTLAGVALVNTTPGLIVVVETATVQAALVADIIEVRQIVVTAVDTELAASQQGFTRDSRWVPVVSEAVVRYGAAAAAITGNLLEMISQPSTVFVAPAISLPMILTFGNGVCFQTTNDASILRVNIGWRERKAYPGEVV